ncbi:cytosolic leucyl tRNA synthetase [Madurella fahalii]|uniref:leucine--tRNA ligase n=1 Tax=Madurella fahalii TaxID=1157608 RepID=A0ABQ0G3I4_9PEZI
MSNTGIKATSFDRKEDTLKAIEKKYQRLWQVEKVFESDAPPCSEYPLDSVLADELRLKVPKFFGHGFTISKVDFTARAARAEGKNTLYPQGYHATGMPIKACADKLANEIAMFGELFAGYGESEVVETTARASAPFPLPKDDVTKFTNLKKGKAALKSAKAKYQFQVMMSLGIPREEIHKFADAKYWLHYFPQLWQQHLTEFGCGIDWRRSFITTEVNPYYDSFVRWQMRRLRDLGKIRFGKRFTVYSPKDGQSEYVGLKCKVVDWSMQAQEVISSSKNIPGNAEAFMIPATLRPETMYGQTNLFVSPSISYGIFKVSDTVFYLATDRAARNMAFQGIFLNWGSIPKVMEIKGSDLIGSAVHTPLSAQDIVQVIPMDTIKETKGTGLVTSVPSDSPDDYITTLELFKKATFYGIDPKWVCQDILPIIDTPEYGNTIALTLVEKLNMHSPKHERQFLEAKELAYKIGFYQGTMVFGPFAGMPVQEAKARIRQQLLDSGDAFVYCEPDGLVISRSGDECVAAFLDQWFLAYGVDELWRDETLGHLRDQDGLGFNCFSTITKHPLEQTFGWMREWSVTRQYGLGTDLPWDPSQMVEGLPDSTISMAYYTVAHFLHSDIYGRRPGHADVRASQMTDGVWEYIFALADGVQSDIPKATLDAMGREFTYWYPLDIRISGKDLVNNHLFFFLYIHQAIWGEQAPSFLPKGIRLNGHLMLNGEKMSKSTGNFLALTSAVQKFGADATRIALTDGGDEFSHVRTTEKLDNIDSIQRTGGKTFWDSLFLNHLNALIRQAVQAYRLTDFKAALKFGFYDFTTARDSYRAATHSASFGMRHECVRYYVECQALMVCVFAPHWADHIWREVLLKPSTVQLETFPDVVEPSLELESISDYVKTTTARVLAAHASQQKRLAKEKGVLFEPGKDKCLNIYVAKSWPSWHQRYIDLVQDMFDGVTLDVKSVVEKVEKVDMI